MYIEKVLVVNDEPGVRKSLEEMVRQHRRSVLSVETRTAAEAALSKDVFDLVFLSSHLSDGEGKDVLKYLSDLPAVTIKPHAHTSAKVYVIKDEQAERLIAEYDVRSSQGPMTTARSMSGGNQQKAIIAREIDKAPELLVAVQPTRGLDVGAIEFIHSQLVAQRDAGKAVLLVSLELDEVMDVPDRILVMYEGEIVGELDPKTTTQEELGLYMAGAKRDEVKA